MITTILSLPPIISQSFSRSLLSYDNYKKTDIHKMIFEKIIERATKKYDHRHSGKFKEIEKLKLKWNELYERAKIKEEKYEEALKNAPKMSYISSSEGTVKFKRFRS